MKIAFEDGDIAPNSPAAKNTPAKPKATPKSRVKKNGKRAASTDDTEDAQDTPSKAKTTRKPSIKKVKAATTPIDSADDADAAPNVKRKRVAPKKSSTPAADDAKYKLDDENEADDEKERDVPSKRAKFTKSIPKSIPKPKPKPKPKPAVKEEPSSPEDDFASDQNHSLGLSSINSPTLETHKRKSILPEHIFYLHTPDTEMLSFLSARPADKPFSALLSDEDDNEYDGYDEGSVGFV